VRRSEATLRHTPTKLMSWRHAIVTCWLALATSYVERHTTLQEPGFVSINVSPPVFEPEAPFPTGDLPSAEGTRGYARVLRSLKPLRSGVREMFGFAEHFSYPTRITWHATACAFSPAHATACNRQTLLRALCFYFIKPLNQNNHYS
jgi:hypothetical protein